MRSLSVLHKTNENGQKMPQSHTIEQSIHGIIRKKQYNTTKDTHEKARLQFGKKRQRSGIDTIK